MAKVLSFDVSTWKILFVFALMAPLLFSDLWLVIYLINVFLTALLFLDICVDEIILKNVGGERDVL